MAKLNSDDIKYLNKLCRYIQSEGYKHASFDDYFYDIYELSPHKMTDFKLFYNSLMVPGGLNDILEKLITQDNISDSLRNLPVDEDYINSIRYYFNIDCKKNIISASLDFYYTDVNEESVMLDDSNIEKIIDDLILSDDDFSIPESGIIELRYEGGGDSGYLDSLFKDGQDVPGRFLDFCYRKLENNFGGWEINEGSQGEFIIDFNDKTISINHGMNVEESYYYEIFHETF
jgi:hypothetical protein